MNTYFNTILFTDFQYFIHNVHRKFRNDHVTIFILILSVVAIICRKNISGFTCKQCLTIADHSICFHLISKCNTVEMMFYKIQCILIQKIRIRKGSSHRTDIRCISIFDTGKCQIRFCRSGSSCQCEIVYHDIIFSTTICLKVDHVAIECRRSYKRNGKVSPLICRKLIIGICRIVFIHFFRITGYFLCTGKTHIYFIAIKIFGFIAGNLSPEICGVGSTQCTNGRKVKSCAIPCMIQAVFTFITEDSHRLLTGTSRTSFIRRFKFANLISCTTSKPIIRTIFKIKCFFDQRLTTRTRFLTAICQPRTFCRFRINRRCSCWRCRWSLSNSCRRCCRWCCRWSRCYCYLCRFLYFYFYGQFCCLFTNFYLCSHLRRSCFNTFNRKSGFSIFLYGHNFFLVRTNRQFLYFFCFYIFNLNLFRFTRCHSYFFCAKRRFLCGICIWCRNPGHGNHKSNSKCFC